MGDFTHTFDHDFLLASGLAIAKAAGIGPDLTYTGNGGTGLIWDENAVLVSTTDNQPRFNHDPVTGAALGLLIEEQRENEALWNRDLTKDGGSPWTIGSATAAKDATGLDGVANSASTLTATSANGTCGQTITKASAENTYSVWIKRKTGTGDIAISDNNGVNWTTVAVTTTWKRFSITRTQANPVIGIKIVTDTDAIYVDMHQLEAGAKPSSEIPTTNAAVTRTADVLSTATLTWLNANAGTLFVQGSIPFVGAAERSLITIDDGTATDRLRLYMDAAENCNFETVNSADTNGASDGAAVIAVDTTFKVAGAYADDDVRAAVDGTLSAADSAAGIPVTDAATTMRIGNDSAGTPFNGHIVRVKYWDVRKSNAFLQAVTA